jgi:hypothetical protein
MVFTPLWKKYHGIEEYFVTKPPLKCNPSWAYDQLLFSVDSAVVWGFRCREVPGALWHIWLQLRSHKIFVSHNWWELWERLRVSHLSNIRGSCCPFSVPLSSSPIFMFVMILVKYHDTNLHWWSKAWEASFHHTSSVKHWTFDETEFREPILWVWRVF